MNNDRMPTSLLDLVFSDVPDVFHSSVDVMSPISSSDHLPLVIRNIVNAKSNRKKINQSVRWHCSQEDD